MKMKKLASVITLGLGLSFAAGPSFAAVQEWAFQDDDIDFLLEGDEATGYEVVVPTNSGGSGGTIDVGDTLLSVFEMSTYAIDGVNVIPPGKEVTGVLAITVVDKDFDIDGDGVGGDWLFGAPDGGLNAVLADILGDDSVLDGEGGAGSMLAMWINDATDTDDTVADRDMVLDAALLGGATNCTSYADCVTEATMGDLLQVDGYLGDGDEIWTADLLVPAADDIDAVASLNRFSNIATVNFALSNFFNAVEPVIFHDILDFSICDGATINAVADGCAQVSGNANVTGGQGLVNEAFAHSDQDLAKFVEVPEPATLLLLGAGLMAMVGIRRRVKS
jgi:hypothetical protein